MMKKLLKEVAVLAMAAVVAVSSVQEYRQQLQVRQ